MVDEWKINGKEIEKFHLFLLRELHLLSVTQEVGRYVSLPPCAEVEN